MTLPRAEPIFFGPVERPLFGWLHRPPADTVPSVCLVLCNPFGYEAICAHRSLRHFAEAAALEGIPALRFDYDGTGDSAGSDLDPERVRAWTDSVHRAIETARREFGCDHCCLLGIRLGATLAALAAGERDDIDSLIAIAPIVNAKAYTRELRALQMATGLPSAPAGAADAQAMEATGFVISGATREALATVNLTSQSRPSAPRVLILDRDDLPGSERWADQLQSLGADVERRDVPGYVEMMLNPHGSIVPEEMLNITVQWLRYRAQVLKSAGAPDRYTLDGGTTPTTRRSITVPALAGSTGGSGTETVEFLDAGKTLFGVLSLPDARVGNGPRKGIVLLNAGATHHIGPNRLYVLLARQLAALGNVVLRVDQSGIGDSLPRPGELENVVYSTRAAEDLAAATRFLREQAGVTECYALGLCSGAYHAFKAAVGGAQVDALVLINPLTFFWKEGMSLDAKMPAQRVISEAQRYQQTAFQLQSWLKLLRGEVDVANVAHVMFRRTAATVKHTLRDVARRLHFPLRDDLGRELEAVAERGIAMHFVFAENDPGVELLRIEGGSAVGKLLRRRLLDIEILGEADHTFTPRRAREQLLQLLVSTLQRLPAS